MSNAVLFVCHANICRSPLMAAIFENTEVGSTLPAVRSAGVVASPRAHLCAEVGNIISQRDADEDVTRTFRPAQLSLVELRRADLVITASRAERSHIATLDPSLRARTFTLREAIALSRLSESENEPVGRTLADYASHLDRNRGRVGAVARAAPFARWRPRSTVDDLDVPDAHNRSVREHRRMLRVIQSDVRELAMCMGSLIDLRAERRRYRQLPADAALEE